MKIYTNSYLYILILAISNSACTSTGQFEISGSDVPPSLTFQGVKYRTGNASSATKVGSIVVKRTYGRNKISHKIDPELKEIKARRVATFTKNDRSRYQVLAELTTDQIKEIGKLKGGFSRESFETGIYSLWRIESPAKLIDELNKPKNKRIRAYLSSTEDMRIVTGILKVNSHQLSVTSSGNWEIIADKSGSNINIKQDLTDNKVENVENLNDPDNSKNSDPTAKPGLSIADGTVYAYEFSRVLWSVKPDAFGYPVIVDILADYPRNWWQVSGDSENHKYGDRVSLLPPVRVEP